MSTAWKLSMQGITKKRPGPCTVHYSTVLGTDNTPPPTHRGAAALQSAQPEDHCSLVLLDHLQIFSHGYICINTLVIVSLEGYGNAIMLMSTLCLVWVGWRLGAATLRQKRRERGSMTRMMRVLTPVSSIEHGPGPVGSAATTIPCTAE